MHFKFEAFLHILYNKCFDELKDQFQFPKSSIFDIQQWLYKSPRNITRVLINAPKQLLSYRSENNFDERRSIQSKDEVLINKIEIEKEEQYTNSKKIHIKKILQNLVEK